MKILKTGFILLFAFFISTQIEAQISNNDGAIVRTIKCPKKKNENIEVSITITPNKIQNLENGYQRLVEIIPEGFSAEADKSTTAACEIKENKLKFYWMNGSLPINEPVTVSYTLTKISKEKIKSVVIEGSFKYSVFKESQEIVISGDNSCKL